MCCNNLTRVPITNPSAVTCCAGAALYDPLTQICCGGAVNSSNMQCCGTNGFIDPMLQQCCNGVPRPLGETCCGSTTLDSTCYTCLNNVPVLAYNQATHMCCRGIIQRKIYQYSCCCGSILFDASSQSCCNDIVVPKDPNDNSNCCRMYHLKLLTRCLITVLLTLKQKKKVKIHVYSLKEITIVMTGTLLSI